MKTTLVIDGFKKSFGATAAIKELSLSFSGGEFVLLLGANGAGKSTLLRILSGIGRADKGRILLNDEQVKRIPEKLIGYISHQTMLYSCLTVEENLSLTRDLLGLNLDLQGHIEKWDLQRYQHTLVSELSKGLSFRAGLCRALMHNPTLIFLDEPTSALDHRSAELLLEELNKLKAGNPSETIIVLATHDINRTADAADRVVVLKKGELIKDQIIESKLDLERKTREIISLYLEAAA